MNLKGWVNTGALAKGGLAGTISSPTIQPVALVVKNHLHAQSVRRGWHTREKDQAWNKALMARAKVQKKACHQLPRAKLPRATREKDQAWNKALMARAKVQNQPCHKLPRAKAKASGGGKKKEQA